MEQVQEIDGEQAYEKMRRAVERASQPVRTSQFPPRDRPERRGLCVLKIRSRSYRIRLHESACYPSSASGRCRVD